MKQMKKAIVGLVLIASLASGMALASDTKFPAVDISKDTEELDSIGFLVATQRDTVPVGTFRPWITLVRSLMGLETTGEVYTMGYIVAIQQGTVPAGTLRPWINLVRSLAGV